MLHENQLAEFDSIIIFVQFRYLLLSSMYLIVYAAGHHGLTVKMLLAFFPDQLAFVRLRLQELQEQMVGGEAVGNSEIKERRKKKKRHAEEKRQALAGKNTFHNIISLFVLFLTSATVGFFNRKQIPIPLSTYMQHCYLP